MKILDEAAVRAALPWGELVEALRATFAAGCEQPLRTAHSVGVPGEPDISLLMMPAWQVGERIAVKMVCIVPGNSARGLPAVAATVVVFDGTTGAVQAVAEGGELTARRTAATSALAADYLARKGAETLLIVGAGRIAENLIPAHCTVRPYKRVLIWARKPDQAADLAARSTDCAAEVAAAPSLGAAVAEADVISCATLAIDPLVPGASLKPGVHLDLVGGYRTDMREADDEAVRRARGGIIVDTYDGALSEAGDLTQPLESGVIARRDIVGDLAELCRGEAPARKDDAQITLFKSVGAAIEDYAAAAMAAK